MHTKGEAFVLNFPEMVEYLDFIEIVYSDFLNGFEIHNLRPREYSDVCPSQNLLEWKIQ